jgi:hypothetical protein
MPLLGTSVNKGKREGPERNGSGPTQTQPCYFDGAQGTIGCQSGDQSYRLLSVSIFCPEPSLFITKTSGSERSPNPGFPVKAIFLPLGDQAGSSSIHRFASW